MIATISAADIDGFRVLLTRKLGLFFDDGKSDFLADVLRQRMERTGCSHFAEHERRLAPLTCLDGEIQTLAEALTIGETYFFRYGDQFEALARVALPACIAAREEEGERSLRILSAGCSSGEEAYSIAILLKEAFPQLADWNVSILGIDVNPAAVEKATAARYSRWSLRETPEELATKYFEAAGKQMRMREEVRRAARFEQRNLAEEDNLFWQAGSFDIVFCRNVTIYFPLDVTRCVVARIARSLRPGGYFFMGHAETLRGISNDFHLHHTHNTFYYQRREAVDAASGLLETMKCVARSAARPGSRMSVLDSPSDGARSEDSWSGSPAQLAAVAVPIPQGPGISGATSVSTSVAAVAGAAAAPALELLRRERFVEAKEFLRDLPPGSAVDPDAQLLLAVLHTNSGEIVEAEKIARQVLAADELNTGAHYLIALCREHASDRDGAVRHNQAATYLDPLFAMPHLHLGLLAKRAADTDTARRELGLALALFDREDPARILLFGGGFTREALVEFCRAELRACGGNA
jgi:chemotaxis protein methyltransferase CheR